MKAIQINKHGEPELLKLVDIAEPEVKEPTDVKIKLKAAGVNPIDTKLRSGFNPALTFPAVLGCDGAGIVEECGADVSRFKEGDEVYFFHGGLSDIQGNYAEYKVLNEHFLALKPRSLDFSQAAAAPLVLITAWEALFDRAHLEKDQTVLINAGAGGVGHVAIQLAKSVGATVCTTISSVEKANFVKELGADHIINYKEQEPVKVIMEQTDNKGVDIVMDNVGGNEIEASFPAIKHYGEMVSLLLPDKTVDWSVARIRNISFSLEVMLSPLLFDLKEAQCHQAWILEQCATLIDDGKLSIKISGALPLEQAAEAHKAIETGHSSGKIVLTID